MANAERPLSPHLQIYRPQLTSVLSITHRATGMVLSLSLIVLVAWLVAAAGDAQTFTAAQAVLSAWPGQLLLLGVSFAFFFHLCNGIRHLVWDLGHGFELAEVYASGWAVVISALALTVLAWVLGLVVFGGGA